MTNYLQLNKISPVVASEKYQTLLSEYSATLMDVPLEKFIFPVDSEQPSKPVSDALIILIKEMIIKHHQLRAITVRETDGCYQVIDGETQLQAMMDLGYKDATVLVLHGVDDAKATEIRKCLMTLMPEVPYSVVIPKFQEMKKAVKDARQELKSQGKVVPTTNEILSETIAESVSYVKVLDHISQKDNAAEIAGRLDQGESIYSVTIKGSKAKNTMVTETPIMEGRKCEVPAGFDLTAICLDCPRYMNFMSDLNEMQKIND